MLSCSNQLSRNFTLGIELGVGKTLDEAGGELAEGRFTAPVVVEMARKKGIEMPIATAVAAILDGQLSVEAAIETLLSRPLRAEV